MNALTAAAAEFNYDDANGQRLEQLRQEFLQRFPTSKLPSLKLEEYALGLEPKENSFCWWLEFNTNDLGRIGGTPAIKHVIFYSREKQEYTFDNRYLTKETAFEAVRKGLSELVRLGGEQNDEGLDKVAPFDRYNLTRGKIVFLYHADKFLPIYSLDHLKDFCVQLGVQADFTSQTAMNHALLHFKQGDLEVRDWPILKFARFLYQKFPPTVHFWKIAPGENAKYWNDCKSGAYICIGWDEVGDMRKQKDEQSFKGVFLKEFPKVPRKWREVWDFAKRVNQGDTVIANNGRTSIVGVEAGCWNDDALYTQ